MKYDYVIISLTVINMRGLYIHIPFCNKLCSFCDFPKRINQKEDLKIKYINKLKEEIEDAINNYTFDTIYIGGGTPNSLSLELLEDLFKSLEKIDFKQILEFTIEANYELITLEQVKLFKKYHINRVSLGVQTLNYEIANKINRYSNYKVLLEKIKLLRENGIENINLDFIFGLPNQTLEDVKKDLKYIKEINPKHISYYSLILEDKTVLSNLIQQNKINLPDDELTSKMYDLIIKELKESGYHHYEISNFAINGYESKHNLLYWDLDEYIGVGMSGASYFDNKRITNSKIIDNYLKNNDIIKNEETIEDSKGEYFWLGLRKIDGVSIQKYKDKFNSDPFKDFKIKDLVNKGLLEINDDIIKLTHFGLLHGNYVFEYFI